MQKQAGNLHDELNAIDIIPGELSNQKRETWIYDSVYTVIGKDKDSLAVEINYKCVYAILKKLVWVKLVTIISNK